MIIYHILVPDGQGSGGRGRRSRKSQTKYPSSPKFRTPKSGISENKRADVGEQHSPCLVCLSAVRTFGVLVRRRLQQGRFNDLGFHGPPTHVCQGPCGFDKLRPLVVYLVVITCQKIDRVIKKQYIGIIVIKFMVCVTNCVPDFPAIQAYAP